MARKDLLKGLLDAGKAEEPATEASPQDAAETRVDPAKPRYSGGAIGAVSQSIQSLKSRSVTEIDPHAIEAGGLQDRLGYDDDEAHFALVESLKTHGQQVPVMVRPHPEQEGKFQIVYGRRRVLALRDAGLQAKALVRDLDDAALIMAQGLENSARRDLSYIEKCNFAAQMREAGYQRAAICDALSVDKTQISRMLQVYDRVGVDLIEAIGAAPGIGRDRWAKLGEILTDKGEDGAAIAGYVGTLHDPASGPDGRFEAAMQALGAHRATPPAAKSPAPRTKTTRRTIKSTNGFEIGQLVQTPQSTQLHLNRDTGFADWLGENLEDVYRQWLEAQTSPTDEA